MDTNQALKVLRSLADGIDPQSGEALPQTSPFGQPAVIRALFRAIDSLEETARRKRAPGQGPENQGEPWSREMDTRLLKEYDSGRTIPELAERFGRTKGGIESRLRKLFMLGRNPDAPTKPTPNPSL